MAWAIKFGDSSYVRLPSQVVLSGDFYIEIKFKLPTTAGTHYILSPVTGQAYRYRLSATSSSVYFSALGTTGGVNFTGLTAGEDILVKWSRTAGTITMECNGVIKTIENSVGFNIQEVGRRSNGTEYYTGHIEYLVMDNYSGDHRHYDATASDHTNGGGSAPYPQPIVIDTVGGNNATGVNFSTTDLDYWVNLGGGGPATTPITLSYLATPAPQLTRQLTLSQSHTTSAVSTPSLTKQIGKELSYLSTSVPSKQVQISKTFAVTTTVTPTLDEGYVTDVSKSYTAAGTVSAIATFIAKGADAIVGAVKYIAIRLGLGI